ncbi:MAG: pyridoxal phosphate-dependent aminotransferase [Candidatus Caldatribacteriota bacterium]|nr:pyridoxal phosphate-dependent aminotransferase [Candidatus Caldatribacteriota bacterium]
MKSKKGEGIKILKYISERANEISYPKIREIFDRAAKFQDVINLGIGDPDFDTDSTIIDRTFKLIKEKKSTHYTPVPGYQELREAIALKYREENKFEVNYEEIIVTHGAQQALMVAMFTLLNPGDEVLILDPYYPSYPSQIFLTGAIPVFIPTFEKNGFKVKRENIEKNITKKTKLLILNTPNNPTGAILEKEDLRAISKIAIKNDLIVTSDEAYETMVYDNKKHFCIANFTGMKERTITINSFSKRYAMTGWRIGYAVATKEIIRNMMKISGNNLSCPCSVSQQAAIVALKSSAAIIKRMGLEYEKRRNFVVAELNKIKGISCTKPEGAFYVFANIKETGRSSEQIYDELLMKGRVVVIPGSAFGKQGEGYIRIAYTLPIDKLKEALERMKRVIEKE